eukprot:PhM_4_TR9179/c1_g1_i2/m.42147
MGCHCGSVVKTRKEDNVQINNASNTEISSMLNFTALSVDGSLRETSLLLIPSSLSLLHSMNSQSQSQNMQSSTATAIPDSSDAWPLYRCHVYGWSMRVPAAWTPAPSTLPHHVNLTMGNDVSSSASRRRILTTVFAIDETAEAYLRVTVTVPHRRLALTDTAAVYTHMVAEATAMSDLHAVVKHDEYATVTYARQRPALKKDPPQIVPCLREEGFCTVHPRHGTLWMCRS